MGTIYTNLVFALGRIAISPQLTRIANIFHDKFMGSNAI